MTAFKISGTIEKFFTYRQARILDKILKIDVSKIDSQAYQDLKSYVAKNGYFLDNHIAFITSDGGAFWYSDGILYVSTPDQVYVKKY